MKERFGDVIEAAADRRPPDWGHGYNALAAVILMDQLTRCACLHALRPHAETAMPH